MVYVLFEVLLPLILGILRIFITHWPTIMLQIFQYSKSAVSNILLLIETIVVGGQPWTIMVNHGKPHGKGQVHVVPLRRFSMTSGDMGYDMMSLPPMPGKFLSPKTYWAADVENHAIGIYFRYDQSSQRRWEGKKKPQKWWNGQLRRMEYHGVSRKKCWKNMKELWFVTKLWYQASGLSSSGDQPLGFLFALVMLRTFIGAWWKKQIMGG